jgi:hypothetical protein
MATERWLHRSRNAWRYRVLVVAVLALGAAGIACVLALQGVIPRTLQTPLAWSTVWMAAFSIAWFAAAFRCRRCGTRIGLWYATHAQARFWLSAFLHARACPVCRH